MLLQNFRIKATLKYLVILILILVVTIFQDLFPAKSDFSDFNSHPVFLNTFWILVLPIAVILDRVSTSGPLLTSIHALLLRRIVFTLLAALIHILLFAVFVQILSLPIVSQSLDFYTALKFAISMNLYKFLLIYSVVGLVLLKKNRHTAH